MNTTTPLLRIGTRGSPLALAQAREARDRLARAHPELAPLGAIEIIPIKTSGDRSQELPKDQSLINLGGKGLFTKEIEDALLAGHVDIAVHSAKDMLTDLPPGLVIGALLPREDPRDAYFSFNGQELDHLPAGSVVGTVSLRRQAQVLARRPNLRVVPLRGNVETRLRKMADGQVHATLLAVAGLKRIGLIEQATTILSTDIMLPAPAQGALALEVRENDARVGAWIAAVNCAVTKTEVTAERALLRILDGSCRTPIGGLARMNGARSLRLDGLVARPDGSEIIRMSLSGPAAEAEKLGEDLGRQLKARVSPEFMIPLN